MSHYTVALILPASAVPPPEETPVLDHGDVADLVDAALAPYDEGLSVEPYSDPLDSFHLALLVKIAREKGLLLVPDDLGEQPADPRESNAWVEALVARVGIGALLEACSAVSHEEELHLDGAGRIAQRTSVNPQGRWDWFTIGGRWAGKFDPAHDRDVLRIGEIDWTALEQQAREAARSEWENLARLSPERVEGRSRDEFVDAGWTTYLPTAALLTGEGWSEPSRIGWFGSSYNETMSESDWAKHWIETVRSQDEDAVLVLVDCHT
jgi:hypothetical protein